VSRTRSDAKTRWRSRQRVFAWIRPEPTLGAAPGPGGYGARRKPAKATAGAAGATIGRAREWRLPGLYASNDRASNNASNDPREH